MPGDGAFGFGDLLIDTAQRAPGPVVAELVPDLGHFLAFRRRAGR
jgi:hypothetical protein